MNETQTLSIKWRCFSTDFSTHCDTIWNSKKPITRTFTCTTDHMLQCRWKKVHFRNFSCCSHTHNTLIPNTQHKKVLLPLLTKSIFHQNVFECNFMLHLHFAVCPNPINQTLISPPLYCKLKWHPSNTRGAICRSSVVANALFATTDSETDFVRNLCYYYGERQLALELLDSAALYE